MNHRLRQLSLFQTLVFYGSPLPFYELAKFRVRSHARVIVSANSLFMDTGKLRFPLFMDTRNTILLLFCRYFSGWQACKS